MKKLILVLMLMGVSACSEPNKTLSSPNSAQDGKVSDDSATVKVQFEFPEFSAVDLKNADASVQVKVYKRTSESEAAIEDLNFIKKLPLKVAEDVKKSQEIQKIELPGTKTKDDRVDKLYASLVEEHENRKKELKEFANQNGSKIEENFELTNSELEDYYRLFPDAEEKIKKLQGMKKEAQQEIYKKQDIQSELVSELKVELEKFSRSQNEIQFTDSTPFSRYALRTTETVPCKASKSNVVVDAIAELQICGYFDMGNEDPAHSEKLAEILKPYFLKIVQLKDEIEGRKDLANPKIGLHQKIEQFDLEIKKLENNIENKMQWSLSVSRMEGDGGKSDLSLFLESKNKENQKNKELLELYHLINNDLDLAAGKNPNLSRQNQMALDVLLKDYAKIADEKFNVSTSSVYNLIGKNSNNTNKFIMSIPKQAEYLVVYPSMKFQEINRMEYNYYTVKVIENIGDHVSSGSVVNFEIRKDSSDDENSRNIIHLDKKRLSVLPGHEPHELFDFLMEDINKSGV